MTIGRSLVLDSSPQTSARFIDLTDKRFGFLWVKSYAGKRVNGQTYWNCICDCGRETIVRSGCLKQGNTMSCGCYRRQRQVEANTTHGMSVSGVYPEYMAWTCIKNRCLGNNAPWYKERGIKMCDRWIESFENFLSDVGPKPSGEYSIDRKDNNGNYEPGNVRWATRTEQSRNRSNTLMVEYREETRPLAEWCEILDMDYEPVRSRISDKGWSSPRAFETPIRVIMARKGKITSTGKRKLEKEAAA